MTDAWKFIGAALTAGAMLLGVGRYVGNIEQRITHLESQQFYLHGAFDVPKGVK